MKLCFVIISFLLIGVRSRAQHDSLSNFSFTGYAEIYYSYDFLEPVNHEKPFFVYNHKRHNEVNLNLAFAKASYQIERCRANLALMAGNYSQYNLANEPEMLKFVYEANIGVRLSKKKNLWIDAGIMPSHIGFESAVGIDCWNLTRSILAENSPYYESGIRLSYTSPNEKLYTSILYLNGWQHIQRPDGIQKPSGGVQLSYKFTKGTAINYSNFIGTDKPDSLHSLRTYHNFYLIYDPQKKFSAILGFDIGTDKKADHNYGCWYSPVIIARQKISKKFVVAARVEYFNDKYGLITTAPQGKPFQTFSGSVNLDYWILKNLLCRVEFRNFNATEEIFLSHNNYKSSDPHITAAICLKL